MDFAPECLRMFVNASGRCENKAMAAPELNFGSSAG